MPSIVIGSSSNLQVTRQNFLRNMLNSGQIQSLTSEYLALERRKNVVSTIAHSGLIGSLSYLQVTRTEFKSRMNSNASQIGLVFAWELLALEC